jgi:hypothetical protein
VSAVNHLLDVMAVAEFLARALESIDFTAPVAAFYRTA